MLHSAGQHIHDSHRKTIITGPEGHTAPWQRPHRLLPPAVPLACQIMLPKPRSPILFYHPPLCFLHKLHQLVRGSRMPHRLA